VCEQLLDPKIVKRVDGGLLMDARAAIAKARGENQ